MSSYGPAIIQFENIISNSSILNMNESANMVCRSILKRGSLLEDCQVSKETFEREPKVHRYTVQPNFNYQFTQIENTSEDKTYTERVTFTDFEGCRLCQPHQSSSYHLQIDPHTSRNTLIKLDCSRFLITRKMVRNTVLATPLLAQKCIRDGSVEKRGGLDIWRHFLKHETGVIYVFRN